MPKYDVIQNLTFYNYYQEESVEKKAGHVINNVLSYRLILSFTFCFARDYEIVELSNSFFSRWLMFVISPLDMRIFQEFRNISEMTASLSHSQMT